MAQIYLLSACLLWAISFIASKTALESMPPLTVVTLRLAIAAAAFIIWFLPKATALWAKVITNLRPLLILSLLGTSLHYGSQTVGLQYTSASNASLYSVSAPLTIVLIGRFMLGEVLSLKKTVGILTALFGVLTVIGLDTIAAFDLSGSLRGDLFVIFSIVLWGFFTVYGKAMSRTLLPGELIGIVTIIGALTMVPLYIWEAERLNFGFSQITMAAWWSVLFLGLGCTFAATLFYFMALRQTESHKVGVYLYSVPPMTYLIAALFLNEPLTISLGIGTLLVISGVYLTEQG